LSAALILRERVETDSMVTGQQAVHPMRKLTIGGKGPENALELSDSKS
jgi:hypothetical protein